MRVLKFGGTSVANAARLKAVSDIVISQFKRDNAVLAVVSAFSGMTDLLLSTIDLAQKKDESYLAHCEQFISKVHLIASELLKPEDYQNIKADLDENHVKLKNLLSGVFLIQEASPKTTDFVVSFGERNCAFLLSTYLEGLGYDTEYVDARKYIKTDASFGAAAVDFELTNELINSNLNTSDKIYIATGFIGSDKDSGVTTTLGRGGSDYSAAIFAAALSAEALEIWTDVNGVLTTDPRKVKKAYTIPNLSYLEAAEMSHFGAKVLYTPTIRPVKEKRIPTYIKNTFEPEHPGTLIHDVPKEHDKIISGLSSIKNISLISLEGSGMQGVAGTAYRFFKCIAEGEINVIMITQASSEHSICIAINSDDSNKAKSQIEQEFELEIKRKLIDPIIIKENLCLIAVIGANMKNTPGVAGRLFETLGKTRINIEAIAQGSSELNITCAISQNDESKALNAIHDAFFLSESKTIHLYMIGVGLIGSTLIEQMLNNKNQILKENRIELIVCGLSNSRSMIFSDEGISLTDFQSQLNNSEIKADINQFIDKIIEDDHPHKLFVDNTASKIIPDYYTKILENNIAISTPNKIALSSGLEKYKALKKLSILNNVPLHFETNVGAGLPVISTLKSLTSTGDKIQKIEAVLSGSVSYIFNKFSSAHSFYDIVMEAKELGFTEPDPRDDLSGSDVRRKILILARESGFDIENVDIEIHNILSENCLQADSVDQFFECLKKDDPRFLTMVKEAEQENKKLRFIASYENGKGTISLQRVGPDNPFYGLSGSDNMIVIHSKRYSNTPLVVRGPGAGAAVTAAGVLAEVISISSSL